MTTCSVCGGVLPARRGPRARRYCSRACQAKAYRARRQRDQEHRIGPGEERELLEAYAGVSATELADRLAAAARRLADALNTGLPADAADLDVMARVPAVLAARARQVAPAADTVAPRPEVQGSPPEPSRDDSAPTSPRHRQAPQRTAPARRKRLSQKAARAVADSARLVKDADHRDTHRWNLIAEDGTVLGHVEPSYGGTGRSGRNGWNYRLAGSFAGSGPYKTREEAALRCALAWTRVATAPVRRTLTVD
ncbi:hypothetical protein [Streptomyces griseomycini]|uniref:Uncharacterized protein n=1 Tax=Streptomyces griseomycini TaxID=66895 RepID=A0A7W7PY35_9ACTN|nr:hypothetical protein [Streptomyces griseomycini]MBB4903471.1 hypothetical protein [Streptomyces griseomycini]GGR56555.1 hypothetical protein GCM10015536_71900 [Streptomyces griseomycini]